MTAPEDIRLERVIARDGVDAESAYRRINAQKSDDYFRTHSDYVIENNGSVDRLQPIVHKILLELGVIEE